MLRCPWEYCSITSRTSYGFRACWERRQAARWIWAKLDFCFRQAFILFFYLPICLPFCNSCCNNWINGIKKKYAAVVGVNICCGDRAKWFPLLSVRVMSSCYSILSKILALHSGFGKHEPRIDNLSGTPMCSISWLIPKPCVNHNVRGLNPRDWPNSEHLDPESNVSEDQRCLVTEILLLEEQGGQMLFLSQETAARGFCLFSSVFHETS